MTTLELEDDTRNELVKASLENFTEEMRSALVDATATTMVGDQAVRIGPAIRIVEKAIEGTAAILRNVNYAPVDDGRLELACLVLSQIPIDGRQPIDVAKDALALVDTMAELVRKGE